MKRKKVEVEDIIGLVQTDEPTNSVKLKKEIYTEPDKMIKISEGLLLDIRHELMTITGLKAVDCKGSDVRYGRFETVIPNNDMFTLDYEELVNKIDRLFK